MLKPFPQRVESTYSFLKVMLQSADTLRTEILHARESANAGVKTEKNFPLSWVNDTTKADSIHFFGYTARYRKSAVTNMDQLYYDQSAPYEKYIPYFNSYKTVANADKPVAYIIPQAWSEVIERLTLNGIKMETLSRDTTLNVEVYYIRDYKSGTKPYEGHYLHSDVQTETDHQVLTYYKRDKIVYCNQSKNRYIIETLEPKGTDAFFAWNFFDAILQQKEWFSDYVFDPRAAAILAENPQLKKDFDLLKKSDSSFANNRWAMLTYVYQHSEYYEKSHNRYPVARLLNDPKLPVEELKRVLKTAKNSMKTT
jgi:hypothetical protein